MAGLTKAFEFDLAPANMLYATYSTDSNRRVLADGSPNVCRQRRFIQSNLLAQLVPENRLQVNLSAYHWKYEDLQDQREFRPLGNVNS